MRREKRNLDKNVNFKNIMYISGSILGLAIIAFIITFIVYGNKLNKESNTSKIDTEKIAELVPNTNTQNTSQTEQTSTQMGKTVEESKNEESSAKENTTSNTNSTKTNTTVDNKKSENTTKTNTSNNNKTEENVKEEKKEETKEPTFIKPVEGDIIKEFAKDNLVFSQTLNEWITHLGIDIKAEKTTVVKATSDGKVKAIKNDPRYGLTVIIEHSNGYSSVYSNLLTAEFVVAGEEVKQGQTIGTVGSTANFEIADESHLHFEILKDNTNVDPTIYMK